MEIFWDSYWETSGKLAPFIGMATGCVITALIARHKGRNPLLWGLYGALLTLIAIIHVLLISHLEGPDWKKCPFCAEIVKREANICKHCGKDL